MATIVKEKGTVQSNLPKPLSTVEVQPSGTTPSEAGVIAPPPPPADPSNPGSDNGVAVTSNPRNVLLTTASDHDEHSRLPDVPPPSNPGLPGKPGSDGRCTSDSTSNPTTDNSTTDPETNSTSDPATDSSTDPATDSSGNPAAFAIVPPPPRPSLPSNPGTGG